MKYPALKMPDFFTRLLKVNMQSSGQHFVGLQKYILDNQSFTALVELGLKDIDKDLHIERIIKALGWHGFRDRIATMFIYKEVNGDYPRHIPQNGVYGLLTFEDKVKPYTIAGYSRAFLLGFYQKLMLLHLNKTNPNEKHDNFLIDDTIIALLRFSNSRAVNVDWLLIVLKHFTVFLGYEKLENYLKSGVSYEDLFSLVTKEQRQLVMDNLLSYGSSINDAEIFYSQTI